MRRQTDQQEIEDMKPVAWKTDGTPTRFEIVHRPAARVIGADDDAPMLPPAQPSRMQYTIVGNPVDEAKGFTVRVSLLAGVLALAVVVAAAIFGPGLSLWTLLGYFVGVFAATWAGAFVLDAMRSPGGIELFHATRMWAFLDREQAHRHNRYTTPKTASQRTLETVLFAAAMGVTVLAGLGLLVAVFMEQMPR